MEEQQEEEAGPGRGGHLDRAALYERCQAVVWQIRPQSLVTARSGQLRAIILVIKSLIAMSLYVFNTLGVSRTVLQTAFCQTTFFGPLDKFGPPK